MTISFNKTNIYSHVNIFSNEHSGVFMISNKLIISVETVLLIITL